MPTSRSSKGIQVMRTLSKILAALAFLSSSAPAFADDAKAAVFAEWLSGDQPECIPRARLQALASVGRAGVPVTVRLRTVILGPSSGGQGPNTSPNLARTGSDGVAEGHKRRAAARVCATFSSKSTARAFAWAEARLFPAFTPRGHLSVWTGDDPIRSFGRN
jgi:hypothetical protein